MFGMFGRIRPREILSVAVQAAPRVCCVHCRRHVYYLKKLDGGIVPTNLAPLDGGLKPTTFICPACGQDIRAFSPEATLKTDRGYLK